MTKGSARRPGRLRGLHGGEEGEGDGRVDQDEQACRVKTGEPDDEGGKPRPEGQAEEERASPSEDDGRRRHPRGRIEADIGDRGEEMHRRDMEVAGEDESRRREDAARDVVAEDSGTT